MDTAACCWLSYVNADECATESHIAQPGKYSSVHASVYSTRLLLQQRLKASMAHALLAYSFL